VVCASLGASTEYSASPVSFKVNVLRYLAAIKVCVAQGRYILILSCPSSSNEFAQHFTNRGSVVDGQDVAVRVIKRYTERMVRVVFELAKSDIFS